MTCIIKQGIQNGYENTQKTLYGHFAVKQMYIFTNVYILQEVYNHKFS